MTENLAVVAIKQIQRTRLVAVFGNAGALVILDYFSELERTFGERQ
jgi:hypothetical protein